MASVAEKLYPPIIGGSIPAFYSENGTAIIAVPFSMNRAVSEDLIGGFRLKIKTVQSNTFIKELTSYEVSNSITNRVVKFTWEGFGDTANPNDTNKIRVGQYLKIQLAYITKTSTGVNTQGETVVIDGTVGYFSTVGTIKYTSKPSVYIEGLGNDTNRIEAFRSNYIGVYETGEDKSERPYSYKFSLYDRYGELVETSGWCLHNTSINNISSESLSLNKASDTYTFQMGVDSNEEYYLQYGVRTINNLEVYSPIYTCIEPHVAPSEFAVKISAINVFEEGYINLRLYLDDDYYIDATDTELIAKYGGDYVVTNDTTLAKTIYKNGVNGGAATVVKTVQHKSNVLNEPISIEICRAEKTDGFSSWRSLTKVYFTNYAYALTDWDFSDFIIEQGITYKYCFRQYNKNGVSSDRMYSNEVVADFEDMFLLDDSRQLKIRFNPKVTSFKMNKLESKFDTIGSRYPFIFRNGTVEYREFPIAGLISYYMDQNEWFLNREEDLNILSEVSGAERIKNPVPQDENDVSLGKSWEVAQTLNSTGYNMRAERRFKMKLLEWLNDGKIKMFKSPAEGNYLVRILNVSLSPEDKLGRMLHSFSCTAYEVEELTYENLVSLGFLNLANKTKSSLREKSILIRDVVHTISNNNTSVKLNTDDIINYLKIETSPNVQTGPGFFVRMGKDDTDHKVYVQPGFIIKSDNTKLPDVFFNLQDNASLISGSVTVAKGEALVADSVLTYQYNFEEAAIGEFYNIDNVYIQNEVKTVVGDTTLTFQVDSGSNIPTQREVLKFFVLNFKKKKIIKLSTSGGKYYIKGTNTEVTSFDPLCIYRIYNGDTLTATAIYKNNRLTNISSISYNVTLIDENNFTYTFNDIPILNLNEHIYRSISLGNGVYLECAYQVKITEFKVDE